MDKLLLKSEKKLNREESKSLTGQLYMQINIQM